MKNVRFPKLKIEDYTARETVINFETVCKITVTARDAKGQVSGLRVYFDGGGSDLYENGSARQIVRAHNKLHQHKSVRQAQIPLVITPKAKKSS